jgi:hypothetical protein
MKCPPTRRCLKCNPSERAMYLEPKPVVDCVYCKNCGAQILITEYQQHLETCQPQGGMP